MTFLELLQTFYSLTLGVAPWFALSLVLTALSVEYLRAHTLDRLLKDSKNNAIPIAVLLSVFLPATSAYKAVMAALARRGGARLAPVLAFTAAGAGAGFAALIVTFLMGWQFAVIRLVVALALGFVLALVFSKVFDSKFAAAAIDAEVEPMFTRDFVEVPTEYLKKEGKPSLLDLWRGLVRVTRIAAPWFLLSLLLASLLEVFVPDAATGAAFGGRFAALGIALLGIPFYFIGGADIPLVYVLTQKGMGTGGAVAFMLAAPLINVPVFVTVKRWLGYRMTMFFMAICWLAIAIIGVALDFPSVK